VHSARSSSPSVRSRIRRRKRRREKRARMKARNSRRIRKWFTSSISISRISQLSLLELTITYSSNTIFGFTEPGSGKNKTECQDSYSIIDIPEDHLKYFAVYDGHGHVGKSVSAQRIS
jgi:hypothetical protein